MGRIIIADHEPLFREGVRAVLAHVHGRNGLVYEIEDADTLDAITGAVENDDDVDAVILDVSLLNGHGAASILSLHARLPDAALVIFAPSLDPGTARLCLTCGAVSYLLRTARRDEIFAALQNVFSGGHAVSEPVRTHPADRQPSCLAGLPQDSHGALMLSSRQTAVLNLVRDGKPNKQIAWELSISETTVKAHMTAILRKLGVNSRAQAIVLLQRQHARDAAVRPPSRIQHSGAMVLS